MGKALPGKGITIDRCKDLQCANMKSKFAIEQAVSEHKLGFSIANDTRSALVKPDEFLNPDQLYEAVFLFDPAEDITENPSQNVNDLVKSVGQVSELCDSKRIRKFRSVYRCNTQCVGAIRGQYLSAGLKESLFAL